MSKTILTKVNGWTPLIDAIVSELGYMSAMVFGVIWRHCQMKDQICYASHSTLANLVGVSRKTITRHANKLVKAGYLDCENVAGDTVVYSDTGKAAITSEITAKVDRKQLKKTSEPVTLSHRGWDLKSQGGVPLSPTNKTILKETMNIKNKSEKELLLDDHFSLMHKALFSDTFTKTWWDIMELAPKKLEGNKLIITVDNPGMIEEVNTRIHGSYRSIAAAGFPFKSFILEGLANESG